MGLVSMTGFGRAQPSNPQSGRASIEVRTLNNRFFDLECRLPEGFDFLEVEIRALMSKQIRRGRVRVSVELRGLPKRSPVSFQSKVAKAYVRSLRAFAKEVGVPAQIQMETLLSLPQVVISSDPEAPTQKAAQTIRQGIAKALEQVASMRQREGRRLEEEIRRILRKLEVLRSQIEKRTKESEKDRTQKLADRIGQLLADSVEKHLVAKEAAAWVGQNDVTEELVRVSSHLQAMKKVMSDSIESPGRTIDFLAQELHREANTLGTKTKDAAVTRWVVSMKGEIEKLREQASNIE